MTSPDRPVLYVCLIAAGVALCMTANDFAAGPGGGSQPVDCEHGTLQGPCARSPQRGANLGRPVPAAPLPDPFIHFLPRPITLQQCALLDGGLNVEVNGTMSVLTQTGDLYENHCASKVPRLDPWVDIYG